MQTAREPNSVVRFGMFEADLRSNELRKNGVKIKIQELPFRALTLLLSHPNEVISRDQFRQALWPDGVYVDFGHGISSAINRLRDALGDSADNPVFIETVERRGYRWIAPTHVPSPTTQLGPVLVKGIEKSVPTPPSPAYRWSLLIFPALALLLALWSFWPRFRAAKANTGSSNPVTARASDAHTASTEAEQFYLKGRFYWEKRTPDGLNKALDFFTQAIVHDPNYSPAYVGLADCYNLLREYTLMPASEAYPRALAAATKAVELDDQSSEAHASLAFALFWGMWDAAGADREFRRAIDLAPNNAVAHHWYATYLESLGRNSESVLEIERAQMLEPASKSVLADKGNILWAAGRHEEGMSLLKQLETAEPDFISPHRYLKSMYLENSDYPNYLKEWRTEAALLQDKSAFKLLDAAEKGYAEGGPQTMLKNTRVLQKSLYEHGTGSPYLVARTDSLLGNRQEALQYLKTAFDRHDDFAIQIVGDWALNSLHDEPAYKELIARLGFPARN